MELYPAEEKLWACAERGETADYRTAQEQRQGDEWRPTVEDARGWRLDRTIRAEVIHKLFRRGYSVRLDGCRLEGDISSPAGAEIAFSAARTIFTDNASFTEAIFTDNASFTGATFAKTASFGGATFSQKASFTHATFCKAATFAGATFTKSASFDGVTFTEHAALRRAKFGDTASFGGATFIEHASFGKAKFAGNTWFGDATFTQAASFSRTIFAKNTWFGDATFTKTAAFDEATFTENAWFIRATFTAAVWFADAWVRGLDFTQVRITGETSVMDTTGLRAETLTLSGAIIEAPVHLDLSARTITARRTRIARYSQLRMCCESADFADADLGEHCLLSRLRVTAEPETSTSPWKRSHPDPVVQAKIDELDKRLTAAIPQADSPAAALLSLERAAVANVTVSGLDLGRCRFHGAHGLDKLRIDPGCTFASSRDELATPAPRLGRWPLTRRRIIAEETLVPGRSRPAPSPPVAPAEPNRGPQATPSAEAPPNDAEPVAAQPVEARTPGEVAETYRALRKSLEDAKNEPGAADFYYGEMEMRRRARDRGRTERALITVYWLVSGYGLRAWRALAFLAVLITIAAGVFMNPSWATVTTSYYPADQATSIELRPVLTPGRDPAIAGALTITEPDRRSLTAKEAALFSLRESVALIRPASDNRFRPRGVGVVADIALRILGPLLIALAVLAIRARTKR